MLKQIVASIDKIYQYAFPRVVPLKRSRKGAMSGPFSRAAYSYSSIRKTSTKIGLLSEASVVLLTANLVVILFGKGLKLNNTMASYFVEHPIKNSPMAYLEPCHTSKMELLRKKLTALSIFAKKPCV